MRNISELISNITLQDDDYESIEAIPFDNKTYTNIVNNTLEGIKDVRMQDKKHIIKRKRVAAILLAATLMLSTTILATTNSINIQEIFRSIFKEDVANIGDSGQVINASMTVQGVELNIEGVVSDENTVDLVFNIRKESGKPFIGNDISFDEFIIEMKNTDNSLQRGITESTYCQQITPISQDSVEHRFRLTTTTINSIKSGEATLHLKNMTESKRHTAISDLNLATWLKEHPQDIILKPNNDARLKLISNQDRIAQLNIPKEIITSPDINLQLFKDDENIKINSIAFVDNKLHMKVAKSTRTLHFQDSKGNIFEPIYISDFDSSIYYVFDIHNLSELENLNAYEDISTVVNKIDGTWDVKFDLNQQNEKMILQPNVAVPLSAKENFVVKEIQLSNTSFTLISNNFLSNDIRNIGIDISFKDNSHSVHLDHAFVTTSNDKNKTYIYKFDRPINMSGVDTISINGKTIMIQ